MNGLEQGGGAGRCDSRTWRWSWVAAREDSAGGDTGRREDSAGADTGGIHSGHSTEVDPDLQLGLADAGCGTSRCAH